jgi:hypothetical protein
MRFSRFILAIVVFSLGFGACAGAPPRGGPELGRPVSLRYLMEGEWRDLSQLRGRPVVLVLISTADIVSQAYLREVAEAFERTAGKVVYLVLSIEPSEAPFLEVYREAEDLPFSVGLSQDGVGRGESDLGYVPVVPTTYIIDEKGGVIDAAAGAVTADDLVSSLERLCR